METKEKAVNKSTEQKKYAGDYVAQVYVIHKSGIVIVRRKYKDGCISSNPHLIGSFLHSIANFVSDISKNNVCKWGENGIHELLDIGMTCSRWFTRSDGNYTLAMLLANNSDLIKEAHYNVIDNLGVKILDSFKIFNFFSDELDGDPEYIADFSDEFGKTIDIIMFETINEIFDKQIEFRFGEEIDISDVDSSDNLVL